MKFDLNENEINKCVVIFKIGSPRLTLTFIVNKIPEKNPNKLKKKKNDMLALINFMYRVP